MLTICLQGRTELYLERGLTKSGEGVVRQQEGIEREGVTNAIVKAPTQKAVLVLLAHFWFTSSQKRIIKVRFSDIQN